MSLAKSSSTSSLAKPGTPRSKPASPKVRSKSKTREDENFFLWIPEMLDDIENQLQSKKRTLELLSEQTESIDKEVQDQLLARDRHISSLNKTILELKTIIKSREDSRKDRNWAKEFAEQEKDLNDLKKSKKSDEDHIKDLENTIDRLTREWEDDKEELIVLQETLKEEIEEFKGLVNSRDSELQEVDSNMVQLQTIIENMTKLNHELHSKLELKNKEMEELNIKSHEYYVKSKQVDELERHMQDFMNERMNLEKKISSLLPQIENISRYNSILEWAEKNLEVVEDGIKKQYEGLVKVDPSHIEKAIIDVNFFFQELSNSISTIRHNVQKNKPKVAEGLSPEVNMRNQLKEMEIEMEKNNNYVKGFKDKEAALLEQIKAITVMMEKHRVEYKNDVLLANKSNESYKEQIERLNEKVAVLRKENEKLAVDLSNSKLKYNHINGKFEQVNKRKKELQENEEDYKKNISELKEKLSAMIDLKKTSSRSSNTTEIKLKKVITQAQILRDEVFRKDSELVKAARERTKLEQEIEGHKGTHSKLNAKMKTIEAETIERISKELEEKDRQIEILKEMLRAAHSEIKLKGSKITTLSRKNDEVERMRSPKRN